MKRKICILMVMSILLGICSNTVWAQEKEMKLLYSSLFQDAAETDSVPYTLRTTGKDEHNRFRMKNGCMNMTSTASGNPGFEFRTGKKVKALTMRMELRLEAVSTDVVLWTCDYNDTSARLLIFTPDGRIRAAQGNSLADVGTWKAGEWAVLEVQIDQEQYSVTYKEKQLVTGGQMPERNNENNKVQWTKNIKSIRMDTYNKTNQTTSVDVSYIVVCEGTEDYTLEDVQAYLKEQEELAAQEPEPEDPNAPALFANSSFNDLEEGSTNTGIGGDKKTNLVYVDAFPDEDNKSIKLEALTGDTFNVLTSFDTAMKEQFIWDFKVYFDSLSAKATLTLRDPQPLFLDTVQFLAGGQIRDINNSTIGTYSAKTWYRAQLAVDVAQQKYSFWLDGKQLVNNLDLPASLKSVGLIRFHIYPPSEGGSIIHIDDWRVYEGLEFLEEDYLEKKGNVAGGSHYTDHERMNGLFRDKLAFAPSAPYYYTGKERRQYDPADRGVKSIEGEGSVLVPLRPVAEGMGGTVAWEDGTVQVQVGENTVSVTENSAKYRLNGGEKESALAARTENGRFYVPVEVIGGLTGKSVTQGPADLYILEDDTKLDLTKWSGYAKEMGRYLLFDHPSQQEIIETLVQRYPENEHPRIMATAEDFARINRLKDTDEQMKKWYENAKKSADTMLTAAPIEYTPNKGDTLLESARTMLSRARTLGMIYNLTKDKKYKDALWKNLVTVCEFPDWYPTHFLDVGEMCMAVAIAYDWLYNDLTKQERKFLEDALEEKGLNVTLHQYETDNQTGYWTVTDNNWNVVCNGGAAVAALAIGDKNPELTGKIIYYALWGLESMMKEYAPDGGGYEGVTYWQYTTSYFIQLMSAMQTALGTDYGFVEAPGIDRSGEFVIQATGPQGSFNFHDAGTAFYSSPEVLWMSSRLQKPELTTNNLYNRALYNLSGGAAELLWYDPEMNAGEAALPLDDTFKGVELAFMRSGFEDQNSIYAGLHGGLNNVNHGQLDNGTFILDAVGERWFLDLGGESYSVPEYFGGKRYNYYRCRAEGQNTLVINPGSGPDQKPSGFGRITKQVSKPRGSYSVLDMTSAYDGVESVNRAMMLGQDRSQVTMRDEFQMTAPSELYWFAHTKADIEIIEDGRAAVLTIGNKQLYAKLSSDLDAKFSVMDPKPLDTSPQYSGQNTNSGTRKLAIHALNVKQGYIQVTFVPILVSGEIPDPALITADTPISGWDALIPEGDLIPFGAEEIAIDGTPVENFNISNVIYKAKYPFGTTEIPQVSASSSTYEVAVEQAQTMPGTARVIVTDPENEKRTKTYLVEFTVLPQIGVKPEGSKEMIPVAVKASDVPQPENPPQSAIDGDLSTRWSAFGVQWIEFDLGESAEITNIELAWMNGDKRVYPFEIYLSEDGENYENVLRSESSKTTNDLEMHQLPKRKARYVRVKCFGNNENEWCSLTEAKIYAADGTQ